MALETAAAGGAAASRSGRSRTVSPSEFSPGALRPASPRFYAKSDKDWHIAYHFVPQQKRQGDVAWANKVPGGYPAPGRREAPVSPFGRPAEPPPPRTLRSTLETHLRAERRKGRGISRPMRLELQNWRQSLTLGFNVDRAFDLQKHASRFRPLKRFDDCRDGWIAASEPRRLQEVRSLRCTAPRKVMRDEALNETIRARGEELRQRDASLGAYFTEVALETSRPSSTSVGQFFSTSTVKKSLGQAAERPASPGRCGVGNYRFKGTTGIHAQPVSLHPGDGWELRDRRLVQKRAFSDVRRGIF